MLRTANCRDDLRFINSVFISRGVAAAALLLGFLASSSHADLDENYRFSFGGSITSFDSNLTMTARSQDRTVKIDLEDDFNYDDKVSLGWLQAFARISGKHSVRAEILPIRRSASTTLQKEIIYDGDTISANAKIESEFNTTIYDMSYLYRIIEKPNFTLDLAAGLYVMDMEIKLKADGNVQSSNGSSGGYTKNYVNDRDLTAPLLLFGAFTEYEITPAWRTHANVRYLAISINNVDGHFLSANIGTSYYFTPKFGIGLSVGTFDLDLEIERSRADSDIVWAYDGAQLYTVLKF